MIAITIECDLSKMEDALSAENLENAQLALAERFSHVMDPYVPYRTGMLAGNVDIQPDGVLYTEEYAGYAYFMEDVNFSRHTHPKATGFWDEAAKSNHLDELVSFLGTVICDD